MKRRLSLIEFRYYFIILEMEFLRKVKDKSMCYEKIDEINKEDGSTIVLEDEK